MVYKYQVHKKVKFSKEDLIRAGMNASQVMVTSFLSHVFVGLFAVVYTFIVLFPIGVAILSRSYVFFAFYSILMSFFTALIYSAFSISQYKNSTLTLEETQAHIEEDSIWGRLFYKRTIWYENVSTIYHTDTCPFGLTPMAKNRKNPQYDKDLWRFYNGSYIVAVDNKNRMFGAVYRDEIWQFLKQHCKNADFYTMEEYNAEIKRRRALDEEHEKYSKMYDGYIN